MDQQVFYSVQNVVVVAAVRPVYLQLLGEYKNDQVKEKQNYVVVYILFCRQTKDETKMHKYADVGFIIGATGSRQSLNYKLDPG